MFYSKQTGGFYDRDIHGANIPEDAVKLTAVEHAALLEAQSNGKQIVPDENGNPVAVDPPPPSANDVIKAQIAALEASITNRRTREAILGADNGWLANVNQQIADLRVQLT